MPSPSPVSSPNSPDPASPFPGSPTASVFSCLANVPLPFIALCYNSRILVVQLAGNHRGCCDALRHSMLIDMFLRAAHVRLQHARSQRRVWKGTMYFLSYPSYHVPFRYCRLMGRFLSGKRSALIRSPVSAQAVAVTCK